MAKGNLLEHEWKRKVRASCTIDSGKLTKIVSFDLEHLIEARLLTFSAHFHIISRLSGSCSPVVGLTMFVCRIRHISFKTEEQGGQPPRPLANFLAICDREREP